MLLESPSSNDCIQHISADTLSRVKNTCSKVECIFQIRVCMHDGSSSSSDKVFPPCIPVECVTCVQKCAIQNYAL